MLRTQLSSINQQTDPDSTNQIKYCDDFDEDSSDSDVSEDGGALQDMTNKIDPRFFDLQKPT